MSKELKIGDKAPDFTRPTNGGGTLSLSDLQGKMAVLYFYPNDNTPGCTREAVDFSALKPEFSSLNTTIVGISKNSIKSHDNFITKHDLTITLLADEDTSMMQDYGVWKLKKLYGREYMGAERSTFLIDENAKIVELWRKVRVKDHAQVVLDAVKAARSAT